MSRRVGGRPLPGRVNNPNIEGPDGEPVLMTEGTLNVEGRRSATFVFWADTAPRPVEIEVLATDGMIRIYNVWDSGRGLGHFESQGATSGMLATKLPDGSRRYRCTDSAVQPGFDRVAFRIQVVNPATADRHPATN